MGHRADDTGKIERERQREDRGWLKKRENEGKKGMNEYGSVELWGICRRSEGTAITSVREGHFRG